MKPAWTREQLVGHLRALGVREGTVFMPHTSYRAIKPVEGGPEAVVEAMLEAVGPTGTLLLPGFTFSYCESGRWDRAETPSEMGIITELLRRRDGSVRSLHPIYSVIAYGARAEEFGRCEDRNGVGDGSAIALLKKYNALMGILGVGYNQGFTLMHHLEWKFGVDFRHLKAFPGTVTDGGRPCAGDWSMLVRDLDKDVVTDIRKWGYMCEHSGAMRVGRFGWAVARLIEADPFVELTNRWLAEGVPELTHRRDSGESRRTKDQEEWAL